MFKYLLIVSLLVSSSVSFAAAEIGDCKTFANSVQAGPAKAQLKKFLDVHWKYSMRESPEYATYVGYPGLNDRWTDYSLAAVERRRQDNRCMLSALKKIKPAQLSGEDRVTYDLMNRSINMSIEGEKFAGDYIPLNHMNGLQIDTADIMRAAPTNTRQDYEDRIRRLQAMPTLTDQTINLMREGIQRKATVYKDFMPKITAQIDQLVTAKVEDSPLYEVFADIKAPLKEEEKTALQGQAKQVLQTKVFPAFQNLKQFIEKEYAPAGRESIAWESMPNGKEWYAYMARYHTTTNKTPAELHQLGVQEVGRIVSEMEKIKTQVGFKGDLKAFNKYLLTDKRFHYANEEELLAGYRDIAMRVYPELPRLFRTLPRLPFGIRPIAAYQAKTAPGGQYQRGSLETGRAGYFEANTHDLKSRPKWDMETLLAHEGVPGHHFQIAIAQELQGLPDYRRNQGDTAYIEGWALYAESLGKELGLYKDPYSHYGHLSAEIMRAIRLVVDTGMHSQGWSKQKAWDYFRANMPTSDIESEIEINRYITWPGQALAYKVGQLKFKELRQLAQAKLGDNFDVRAFHDEVLSHGSVPLDVLEQSVNRWIEKTRKGPEIRTPAAASLKKGEASKKL